MRYDWTEDGAQGYLWVWVAMGGGGVSVWMLRVACWAVVGSSRRRTKRTAGWVPAGGWGICRVLSTKPSGTRVGGVKAASSETESTR